MSGQEVERLAAENAELRAALIERREGLVGMDHAGTVDLDVCLVCRRSAAPGSDIDHRPSCLLARPAAAQDAEGAAMGEQNSQTLPLFYRVRDVVKQVNDRPITPEDVDVVCEALRVRVAGYTRLGERFIRRLTTERDAATARAEALEDGLLHVLTTRRLDVQCEACRQIRALIGPEAPTGREGEGPER